MYLREILHKDSFVRAFLELHLELDVLPEQVVDLFVVDLDEAAADEVGLGGVVLGDGHDLAEGSGDDALSFLTCTSAHHGMSLAATCLPIGKDSPIIAVEHTFDQCEGALLVDGALCGIGGEDCVEGEAFGLLFCVIADEVDLVIFGVDFHDI